MQLKINVPKWLAWTVMIGLVIGLTVAVLFYTGRLSPTQTKVAIFIGACFWLFAAIACWGSSAKIEIDNMPQDYDPKPHLSGAEWKRFQDRQQGW
jgi:hypothetical protein